VADNCSQQYMADFTREAKQMLSTEDLKILDGDSGTSLSRNS
jgi:hypothetical protein